MEDFLHFVLVILALWICSTIMVKFRKTRNKNLSPPGPTRLPIVGVIPLLGFRKTSDLFHTLGRMYDTLFRLKLGSRDVVYINQYKAAEEIFNSPHCQTKPLMYSLHRFSSKSNAGLTHNGVRRIIMDFLGEGDVLNLSLEPVIKREVKDLTEALRKTKGELIDLTSLMFTSVANIIGSLLVGQRIAKQDPEFQLLMEAVDEINVLSGSSTIRDYLPWMLPYLPESWMQTQAIKKNQKRIDNYITKLMQQPESRRKQQTEQQTLLNSFRKNQSKDDGAKYTDDDLHSVLLSFLTTGVDALVASILWILMFFLLYPDEGNKVRAELLMVTKGKPLDLTYRHRLPHLEAFIMECHRLAIIFPFGIPRVTDAPLKHNNYIIPQDTLVCLNLYFMHKDPDVWTNPESFDPSRHLDRNNELIAPYSLGRRRCVAESVANSSLFLIIGSLIQTFSISLGSPRPDPSQRMGTQLCYPPPFSVHVKPLNR